MNAMLENTAITLPRLVQSPQILPLLVCLHHSVAYRLIGALNCTVQQVVNYVTHNSQLCQLMGQRWGEPSAQKLPEISGDGPQESSGFQLFFKQIW